MVDQPCLHGQRGECVGLEWMQTAVCANGGIWKSSKLVSNGTLASSLADYRKPTKEMQ